MPEFAIRLPRGDLLSFGKALKNSFSGEMLGDVTLMFNNGILSIGSGCGGTSMAYAGEFNGTAIIRGGAFKTLVGAHTKFDPKAAWIPGVIDPSLAEIRLKHAGVKARFVQ
jgi:hypothetical protein